MLVGIGGTPEGVIAACAIRSLGGAIYGRLHPANDLESRQARAEGHNLDHVLTTMDLVKGNNAYFVATGITDGEVLRGVRYAPNLAITQSLSMRSSSGAVRTIETKHRLSTSTLIPAAQDRPHRNRGPDDRHRNRRTGRPRSRRPKPSRFRAWLLEGLVRSPAHQDGPGKIPEAGPPAAPLVEGDVPDRRRLFLHPRLPTGHRRAGRRAAVAAGHRRAGAAHPVRRAAGVPQGGQGELPRRGFHLDAGAAAAQVAGQAVRAGAAGFRRHRLPDHHDAVGGGRHRAPGRQPADSRPAGRTTSC